MPSAWVKSTPRDPLKYAGSSVAAYSINTLVEPAKRRRKFKQQDFALARWATKIPDAPLAALKSKPVQIDAKRSRRPDVTIAVRSSPAIPSLRKSSSAIQMPPSLLKWAVARGIKPAPPPPPRKPDFTALQRQRQVFETLRRGGWVYCDQIDYFSSPLKEWLKHCRVRLLRHEGGGRVSGTPVNGYVTEDGLVFYVAEDGATFYVQES